MIVPEGAPAGDLVVTVNNKASNSYPCAIDLPVGSFSKAPGGSLPAIADCSQASAIGDIDGDDDLDIVVAKTWADYRRM